MRIISAATLAVLALCGCQTARYEPTSTILSKDYLACRDLDMIKILYANYGTNPQAFEQWVTRGIMSGNCRFFDKGSKVTASAGSVTGTLTSITDPVTNTFYLVFNPV